MEYPKINSLWKREGWYFDHEKKLPPEDQKNRQSFIVGDYACPEFGNVKTWNVTEKIDGTNIRIYFTNLDGTYSGRFMGRTSEALVQPHLYDFLKNKFTVDALKSALSIDNGKSVVLYGEGYGPKIQVAGPKYRSDAGFILFDVKVGDYWLSRENVKDVATKLGIPVVPDLGIMTEEQIVEFVKSKPCSRCSEKEQVMEGIVARAEPALYFKHGNPVMFKLKCKEFV